MYAIYLALKCIYEIRTEVTGDIHIFTDSSLSRKILLRDVTAKRLQYLHALIKNEAQRISRKVFIHWIPSHLGDYGKRSIEGNEMADKIANAARKEPPSHGVRTLRQIGEIMSLLKKLLTGIRNKVTNHQVYGPLITCQTVCNDIRNASVADALQELDNGRVL